MIGLSSSPTRFVVASRADETRDFASAQICRAATSFSSRERELDNVTSSRSRGLWVPRYSTLKKDSGLATRLRCHCARHPPWSRANRCHTRRRRGIHRVPSSAIEARRDSTPGTARKVAVASRVTTALRTWASRARGKRLLRAFAKERYQFTRSGRHVGRQRPRGR